MPRRRLFHGWWIVLSGAILQLLHGALFGQAYGAYVVVLTREFGWSRTVLSGASALREMETGLIGPLQGWLVDRIGPRRVARIGIVITAIGFLLFSRMNSPTTFYISFVVIAVGASLMGYITITTAIVNWFERRRSTALSLVSVGGALGGVVVPLTIVAFEVFGWRNTALISAALVLIVGFPMTRALVRRPSDMGLEPDGDAPALEGSPRALGSSTPYDFTLREALHEPSFWWLSLGHGSALFVVGAVNVHMVSHLNESLGYSLGAAAGVYSAVTLLFMFGTLAGGWIGDHHSKRFMAFCCMGMHAVGMLLLSHAVNFWMVVAFVLLHGSAWGMRGPQMAALRADYFGRASFGTIMGISNMIVILGAIAGPLIAGYLYDQTGNYRIGFDILALFSAAGSVFFALAKPPAPRPSPFAGDTDPDIAPTAGAAADASDRTEPPQAA